MTVQKIVGLRGEELACAYLERKGYTIVERNWRFRKAEIDIIAKVDDVLIFIEVKTRSNADFGLPEEFLRQQQQKMIADAAGVYMDRNNHDWEVRFDIVSILLKDRGEPEIRHFQDAFFPGEEGC